VSDGVQWIAAQADESEEPVAPMPIRREAEKRRFSVIAPKGAWWQNLAAHNFGAGIEGPEEGERESALDRNPDVWLYRKRTTALLRRYMRLSLEAGRLPSVIGRELFRAKITTYTAVTFEDRVIFVHDVEGCLERLAPFDQEIIARLVLQEHDHERAAQLLQCTRKTIERRLPELLDEMSEEFLRVRLLVPLAKGEPRETARPI
jgi:hypothetical protein